MQPRYGNNYLELREVYTKLKSVNLYSLEFGLSVKKQLIAKLNAQFTVCLGFIFN